MKIALLTEKYPPDIGGLGISVERLALLLTRAGHQVEVIAQNASLEAGRQATEDRDGILVHRLGACRKPEDSLSDWFDFITLRQKTANYHLLHGYFLTQAGFLAAYAGRYLTIPAVVSARGNDLDRAIFQPGKAAHIFYALNKAGAVTANTQELVRKAKALAPGCPVTYIPNGVDANQFRPQPRDATLAQRLGLGETPVVGFAGEARAKKGLSSLLLAFAELARKRPLTLLLVGGARHGEDEDLLKVFGKQNPELPVIVAPDVPLSAMPAYYSLMDVLVMPSRHDGLPNALLEAMACERAVLATTVGGIPDAVQDGLNGCLVEAQEVKMLVGVLDELLMDESLRQRLGHQARLTVMREFTLEQELGLTLGIYKKLTGIL
ncbi:MAG: glycosyltransferase family 4 protein [Anaerolineales bacterium]|nr:glycosyltransferase family 4 protein [Anaerolineales bacterium]